MWELYGWRHRPDLTLTLTQIMSLRNTLTLIELVGQCEPVILGGALRTSCLAQHVEIDGRGERGVRLVEDEERHGEEEVRRGRSHLVEVM